MKQLMIPVSLLFKNDNELQDLAMQSLERGFGLSGAETKYDRLEKDLYETVAEIGSRVSGSLAPVEQLRFGWEADGYPDFEGEYAEEDAAYLIWKIKEGIVCVKDGQLMVNAPLLQEIRSHQNSHSVVCDSTHITSHTVMEWLLDQPVETLSEDRTELKQTSEISAARILATLEKLGGEDRLAIAKRCGELALAEGQGNEFLSAVGPATAAKESSSVGAQESLGSFSTGLRSVEAENIEQNETDVAAYAARKSKEAKEAKHQAMKELVFGDRKPTVAGICKYIRKLRKLTNNATTFQFKKDSVAAINYWKAPKGGGLQFALYLNGVKCNLGSKDNSTPDQKKNGSYKLRRSGGSRSEIKFEQPTRFPDVKARSS